jgi:SAM-dependent methyltransferase
MKSEAYSQAFTVIAPYYDTLMSFINYPSWVSYIYTILTLNNIKEKTILDLACGTGVCLELWWKRGYTVFGLDRSMAMLEMCRSRFCRLSDGHVHLINGDLRNFVLAKKLPIVTCLYDSLNYLSSEEDMMRCFRNVYETLDTQGIFIFDMNTIHCLRDEWGNSTFHRQDGDIHSVWVNHFEPERAISSLELTLHIRKDGTVKTMCETHQERGYPLSTVTTLLAQAGFKSSLYRHLTFRPAEESDLRIMAVARK